MGNRRREATSAMLTRSFERAPGPGRETTGTACMSGRVARAAARGGEQLLTPAFSSAYPRTRYKRDAAVYNGRNSVEETASRAQRSYISDVLNLRDHSI